MIKVGDYVNVIEDQLPNSWFLRGKWYKVLQVYPQVSGGTNFQSETELGPREWIYTGKSGVFVIKESSPKIDYLSITKEIVGG